jgi:Glycosyl transferase family 2
VRCAFVYTFYADIVQATVTAVIETLEALSKDAPDNFALENEDHLQMLLKVADAVIDKSNANADVLSYVEDSLCENGTKKADTPLLIHLAVKIARSRSTVLSYTELTHVSIVFAVYGEINRMKTQAEHENGEDFMMRKINSLKWLTQGTKMTWDIVVVDDGCPDNSGKELQKILKDRYDGDNVRVVFLADAIASNHPAASELKSTNESRKGGSVEYGMYVAATDTPAAQGRKHVVIFTDADLSTHLGQVGTLADPIISRGRLAAIGSRREVQSVSIKKGSRNMRGKIFIYLWKRLLGKTLPHITDTQCGFKAWSASVVPEVVLNTIERQFAFDIELILRTELKQANSVEKVGIAWIDSDAESNTSGLTGPHLGMLKTMVRMYNKYLEPSDEGDAFADFINQLTEDGFGRLITNCPQEIQEAEPSTFSHPAKPVSVEQMKTVADTATSSL